MPSRSKLIQLAHVGAKALFGDDEDARRDYQQKVTGQRSCKAMDFRQLEDLVADLRAKGAITKRPPKRAGRVPFNRSGYMTKIEAQLADMQLSWQYAEAIAWRITGGKGLQPGSQPGVQRLEWVKQPSHFKAIIAALEAEQTKRNLLRYINQLLEHLGKDLAYIDTLVLPEKRGDKWQRHLPTLRAVVDHLEGLVGDDLPCL